MITSPRHSSRVCIWSPIEFWFQLFSRTPGYVIMEGYIMYDDNGKSLCPKIILKVL